jgi:hypothetical protein
MTSIALMLGGALGAFALSNLTIHSARAASPWPCLPTQQSGSSGTWVRALQKTSQKALGLQPRDAWPFLSRGWEDGSGQQAWGVSHA